MKQVERGLVYSRGNRSRTCAETSSGLFNRNTAQTPSPWVAFASQSDVTNRSAIASQNEVVGRNELT